MALLLLLGPCLNYLCAVAEGSNCRNGSYGHDWAKVVKDFEAHVLAAKGRRVWEFSVMIVVANLCNYHGLVFEWENISLFVCWREGVEREIERMMMGGA